MKLVREHINEKFTEDSDPVHDLGIGIYTNREFTNEKQFFDFLIKVIPGIIKEPKIPDDILCCSGIIRDDIYRKVDDYLFKYVTFEGVPITHHYFKNGYWNHVLRKKLIKKGFKFSD